MSDIVIRKVKAGEWEECIGNLVACCHDVPYFLSADGEGIDRKFQKDPVTGRYTKAVEMAEKQFISSHKAKDKAVLYGAYVDGRLAGTTDITKKHMQGILAASFGIAIQKQYWHMGIGHSLMSAAMDFCERNGYTQVELRVASDNYRAMALYREFGFLFTGYMPCTEIRGGRPIDLFNMVKCFGEPECPDLSHIDTSGIVLIDERRQDEFLDLITACRMETPYLSVTGMEAYDMFRMDTPSGQENRRKFIGENTGAAGTAIGALYDGRFVGAASLRPYNEKSGTVAICVLKEHQGIGYGQQLMENILKIAHDKGLVFLTLSVISEDREAVRLFEKYGFRVTGYRTAGAFRNELAYDTLTMVREEQKKS